MAGLASLWNIDRFPEPVLLHPARMGDPAIRETVLDCAAFPRRK